MLRERLLTERIQSAEHASRKTFVNHVIVTDPISRIEWLDNDQVIGMLSVLIEGDDIVFEPPVALMQELTKSYLVGTGLQYVEAEDEVIDLDAVSLEYAIMGRSIDGRFKMFGSVVEVGKNTDGGCIKVYANQHVGYQVKRWYREHVVKKVDDSLKTL